MTFDLENVDIDPKIIRPFSWTIPYYNTKCQHPGTFPDREKADTSHIDEYPNYLYFDLDLCDLDLQIYRK